MIFAAEPACKFDADLCKIANASELQTSLSHGDILVHETDLIIGTSLHLLSGLKHGCRIAESAELHSVKTGHDNRLCRVTFGLARALSGHVQSQVRATMPLRPCFDVQYR